LSAADYIKKYYLNHQTTSWSTPDYLVKTENFHDSSSQSESEDNRGKKLQKFNYNKLTTREARIKQAEEGLKRLTKENHSVNKAQV